MFSKVMLQSTSKKERDVKIMCFHLSKQDQVPHGTSILQIARRRNDTSPSKYISSYNPVKPSV